MIVPMLKSTLLLSAKDKKCALKTLRRLGVVHVEHMTPPQSEDIDKLLGAIAGAEKTLILLEETVVDKAVDTGGKEAVENLLELNRECVALRAELQEKLDTRTWFDIWGDVSLADIELLETSKVYIRLYRTDRKTLEKVGRDHSVVVLAEEKGTVYAVLLARSRDERLDLPEEIMPVVEVADIDRDIIDIEVRLTEIDGQWQHAAQHRSAIDIYLVGLRKDLEYSNVLAGMGHVEGIVILTGYCPEESTDAVRSAADAEGWGYVFETPDDPMFVPTLLKNSKPVRIIEPLFKFMGTLPGYHEVDVSLVFLIFFSLFYAMIIGDGGYGLIFLGGTIFARMKNRKAPIEPFALFFVLSIATIVWGTITGTWFGSRAIVENTPLKNLVIENMFSFNNSTESINFMMKFSFILGLIHLVIGRCMAFFVQLPSIKAIAQLGWAMIVVGIYFIVGLFVLSEPLPQIAMPLILIGLVIVGIFTNFQKNPLKLLGSFVGTILNSILGVISSFSDVVSYIRLFAVGIASVTVASSFNDMANGLFAPLVLLIGHTLNVVLGLMSVMVHGVRLNMLEFSGHLGQEWTGKDYEPFKE
ncbi:hypothetical protein KAR48_10040 [bacterium]|nr:hypothetical protein [bacterium]